MREKEILRGADRQNAPPVSAAPHYSVQNVPTFYAGPSSDCGIPDRFVTRPERSPFAIGTASNNPFNLHTGR
jgi:hypothetical protein